jgi:hypothetical protein
MVAIATTQTVPTPPTLSRNARDLLFDSELKTITGSLGS